MLRVDRVRVLALALCCALFALSQVQAKSLPIPRWLVQRGVTQLYGSGTSSFAGSPPFRITNILNGARKLDGAVVWPGQIFNFNATVGPITPANGFVKGYIIKAGTLEMDVGGGICQVSTTIFRAAYLSGLPIVERNYHSYRVGYYDPLGLEATVYGPWKNFKFRNDTRYPLLIRVAWNLRRQTLSYYLYGGPRDRSAVVSGAYINRSVPPAAPKFIADDKVRFGGTRLIDGAKNGFDLTITRTVTYFGGGTFRDRMRSIYQPWGATWGVHRNDARVRNQKPIVGSINTAGVFGTPVVTRLR